MSSNTVNTSNTSQPVKRKLKIKKSTVKTLKTKLQTMKSSMSMKTPTSNPSIKLIDIKTDSLYDEDGKIFRMQLFGMNEIGKTYSIIIDDFRPFFYIKVPNRCLKSKKQAINEVKDFINYNCNIMRIDDNKKTEYIREIEFVKKHTLYGFDNNKEYIFLKITFPSMHEYNQVKRIWSSYIVGDKVYIRNPSNPALLSEFITRKKPIKKCIQLVRLHPQLVPKMNLNCPNQK